MSNGITVEPAFSGPAFKEFLHLPWSIYAGDKLWVAPLLMDQKKTLARSYPFFEHGDAELFLARKNGKPVGRISAHINHSHTRKFADKRGFFGWFESINDQAVADALFQAARAWLKSKDPGLTHMRGPFQWDVNGENTGLLIEDKHEGRPVVLMPYNPGYYARLIEGAGLNKCMDLYAYLVTDETSVDERLAKLADALRRRAPKLESRAIDVKGRYLADMENVRLLYNSAWKDNWGAIDISASEMGVIAKGLKQIANPRLTRIAFVEGRPAGCLVAVPNINEILPSVNGRLFPFGWLKILTGLKKLKGFRIMLMGVAEEFRGKGVEVMMIADIVQEGRKLGQQYCEMSWVLETNDPMNALARKIGEQYRTYRLYEGLVQ